MGAKRDKRVDLFTPHAYSLSFRGNAWPWPLLSQLLQPGVCVLARACVCDGGFVWGSALNPAHCVFSHGNKWGGPFNTLPHLQWDEQRVQGVQRIYHKKKFFRVTILWSCPHPPTRLSKKQTCYFPSAICTSRNTFPEHFLKGIGSKRIISFILMQIKKFRFSPKMMEQQMLKTYNNYRRN